MSCSQFVLYDESTGTFRIEGLTKTVGGVESYVNDATVTLQELNDSDGTDQLGSPLTMSYVSASNGDYEGFTDIDLTIEAVYTAKITAVSGSLTRTWYPSVLVKQDDGK